MSFKTCDTIIMLAFIFEYFVAKLAKAAAQLKPVSERPPRAAGDSVHQHVEINPNPEIIHRKESLDDAGKVEAAVKSKVGSFRSYF